jgi:hypothetical protein
VYLCLVRKKVLVSERKFEMTKYIKDKSGKFAGSLPGEPKLSSVSPIDAPPIPASPAQPVKPAFGTPEWHEWAEQRRIEREASDAVRMEARTVITNFTDKLQDEFPNARYFVFDEDWNPVAVEGYSNEVVLDLTSEEHVALADTLRIEASSCVDGMKQFVDKDYTSPEGYKGVTMLIRCTESDDCNFRRPARGFAPSHTASPRCMSGKRPHCTCDTCF